MGEHRAFRENLLGSYEIVTGTVWRWQEKEFCHNERWIIESEEELQVLVSRPLPTGQGEIEAYQENKRKLMVKLNQLWTIKESMCRQKARVQ